MELNWSEERYKSSKLARILPRRRETKCKRCWTGRPGTMGIPTCETEKGRVGGKRLNKWTHLTEGYMHHFTISDAIL